MTTQTLELADAIYQETLQLPLDSLLDLAKFVEFLRFRAKKEQAQETSDLRIVKLRGILKDYDVFPEALAAARRQHNAGGGHLFAATTASKPGDNGSPVGTFRKPQ